MLKKQFFKYVLLFLLLGWNFISWAAETEPLYQIEIIVFSHITNEGLQSEFWPALPPVVMPANTLELASDQIVPPSQWLLKPTQQLLEKNKNIILLHLAWQETATSARAAHIIHILGGDTYENNLRQVNGTVAIRLERYFSVHFNLQILLPWSSIQDLNLTNIAHDNNNPYLAFKINERLRMRSNELNYIDHPLYGILIKIVPIPPPAA